MRFVLDSNVYDRVIAVFGLTRRLRRLSRAGVLTILTTHVQEDELRKIPSRWKRFRIGRVPRTVVPTSVFVIDVSRIGQARLGEGHPFEQIRGTDKHTHDGLIAATAHYEDAVLVTGDGRLARRATEAGVQVWSFQEFRARVRRWAAA